MALVFGEPSAAENPGPAPDLGLGLEASFEDLLIVNWMFVKATGPGASGTFPDSEREEVDESILDFRPSYLNCFLEVSKDCRGYWKLLDDEEQECIDLLKMHVQIFKVIHPQIT